MATNMPNVIYFYKDKIQNKCLVTILEGLEFGEGQCRSGGAMTTYQLDWIIRYGENK